MSRPDLDPDAPFVFLVNAASGRHDAATKRALIESGLAAGGRRGELRFIEPPQLPQAADAAAREARARCGAIVAVGGDGTINAVARAAHAHGCAMGVMPQGTFNYFARVNGIPAEPDAAAALLLRATPQPVQLGTLNDRVFLVNASLGLYPLLLQDREAFKKRFGRSRLVALASGIATLLRGHRQLDLRIERGGDEVRRVRTPTLFIGNNRLQLEQVGVAQAPALDAGCLAAVMLRPIGSATMVWLLLRGAIGRLGEADDVESFSFQRLLVQPHRHPRPGRRVKVAFDGEVDWLEAPLQFGVAAEPLWLLKEAGAPDDGEGRR